MERLTLKHLDGPREGESEALDRFPVAIGSAPDVDVMIPGTSTRHAVIDRAASGELLLRDAGSERGTFLAGERVREAVLRDGDIVELGAGGPRIRLVRQLGPRDTLSYALRGRDGRPSPLLRALRRQASDARRSWRIRGALIAVAVLIPAAALLLSHFASLRLARLEKEVSRLEDERRTFQETIDAERARNEEQRTSFERELQGFREREAELKIQLSQAASDESVRRELETTRERILTLESERAAGENIIRQYGAGVCLIQGSYAFYDASGRPLKHRLDESGRKVREDDGSPSLSVDGTGAIYTVDYYGTGFLADRRGYVLTNRHVAVPWWDDDRTEELEKEGFSPRFVLFRAFFPRQVEPFELDSIRHSEAMDLAILKIDLRGQKIPVLPLDPKHQSAVPGQPVVVVGYPTGLEAILAKADTAVVQSILKKHGRQSERVTEELSEKGLIRPSTTQGHIGDVTPTDIVFDAPTTQGGSGGPVFNKAGQVIAIEYAVLPKFGGTAFGIPTHFAVALIKETTARPPRPPKAS
jgi:S1-C subfamily serine protease